MLMIRLQRTGRVNNPTFRLVLTDKRNGPKSGKFLEVLGWHEAKTGKREFDKERISHWLSKGAQPSPTVFNMLVDDKILTGKKKNVLPRKSPVKKEEEGDLSAAPSVAQAEEASKAQAPEAEAKQEEVEPVKTEEPKEESKAEIKKEPEPVKKAEESKKEEAPEAEAK